MNPKFKKDDQVKIVGGQYRGNVGVVGGSIPVTHPSRHNEIISHSYAVTIREKRGDTEISNTISADEGELIILV